jgi:nitrogen fixation NifU-like protein
MTMYNEKVLEHFNNPRNSGVIDDPSGLGVVGNPACGDMMYIYIDVGTNEQGKEYLKDIKWKTFGCGAAIATSSMLTEVVKGRTLEDLLALGENDKKRIKKLKDEIIEGFGELPAIKIHCSILAADGLMAAFRDYYEKKEEASR